MPLYEFICGKCDKDFELLVRSSNWEGAAACPHCGSKKLTKKLSVFASSAAPSSSPAPACGMSPGNSRGCGCRGPHHHH